MTNLMSAYRLAVKAGVNMPPARLAPLIPPKYLSAADALELSPDYRRVLDMADAVAGGVYMFDSTSPQSCLTIASSLGLKIGQYLVASYVDGYGGYSQAVSLFGAANVVSVSVGNNPAMCADVESGAMTTGELPGWVAAQHARGIKRTVIYSDGSQYASCLAAAGSSQSYWTATASGQHNQVLPGRDAVQGIFGGAFDESWVLPTFPFQPGGAAPVSPPPLPASGFPIIQGSTDTADVMTMQGNLNNWAPVIRLAKALVKDGKFGPLTVAAVILAQAAFSDTGPAGTCSQALFTKLAASPASPTPPGQQLTAHQLALILLGLPDLNVYLTNGDLPDIPVVTAMAVAADFGQMVLVSG